jgi:cytoskeletal protein RodZ
MTRKPQPPKPDREALTGRALLFAFGLGVLAFLVAIDHVEWFAIRPATGTSLAMANAATPTAEPVRGIDVKR